MLHFSPFFRPKTSAPKTFQPPPVYLHAFVCKIVLVLHIAVPEPAHMTLPNDYTIKQNGQFILAL